MAGLTVTHSRPHALSELFSFSFCATPLCQTLNLLIFSSADNYRDKLMLQRNKQCYLDSAMEEIIMVSADKSIHNV